MRVRRLLIVLVLGSQAQWLAGCGATKAILNARFEGENSTTPNSAPSGAPVGDQLEIIDQAPTFPSVFNNQGGAAGLTPPSLFLRPVESADDDNAGVRFKTDTNYDSSRARTISWQGRWYVGDHFECRVGGFYGNQFRYGPTVRFKSGTAQTFADGTWHDIAPITFGEYHTVRMRYYPDNTYYVTVQQPGVPEGRYPPEGRVSATSYSIPAIEETERLMLHCQFVSTKLAGSTGYRYVIDDVRVRQD